MKKQFLFSLMIGLLVLILPGCQTAPTNPVELSGEKAIPTPEAGAATVTGQVVSTTTDGPIAETVVRLAEVYRDGEEGAFVLDTAFSPGTTTDEAGMFVFTGIEPKEYVVVIGNVEVYNEYVIIPELSGKAKVWNIRPDQVIDLGTIEVDLPR